MKSERTIKGKILILSILAILISNFFIGAIGYYVARTELNKKGETILYNSVKSAIDMIHIAQKGVEDGSFTLEEAQNLIKEKLVGKLNDDGTRTLETPLDLGENGYFYILDKNGNMIAHHNLEGQYVWDLRDKSKKEILFIQESIEMALNGGGFTYYDWYLPNSEAIARKVIYNEIDPYWGWIICAGSYMMDFNKGAYTVLRFTGHGLFIFVTLANILMYSFSKRLGNAITTVTRKAEAIANLDVTEDISIFLRERNDEVGILANSFQDIVDNLRDFARKITDASYALASSSDRLKSSCEYSSNAANSITKAVDEIAESSTIQAVDTEKGLRHIEELGGLVERNENLLKELNTATKEVDRLKDEGFEILDELLKNTEYSNKSIENIQTVINSTNESAEKIKAASSMIRSIAEQTNLLALNANIEAARAGEVGRGFAVVAEEIRKLAESSNIFAKEITTIVEDLNNKSNEAVATMVEVVKMSKLQTVSVESTNQKFIGISKVIEKMNNIIGNINEIGAKMKGNKDDVITIIGSLATIAQGNAAATEEVAASIEEQTASITEIAESSTLLAQLANELKDVISKFKY